MRPAAAADPGALATATGNVEPRPNPVATTTSTARSTAAAAEAASPFASATKCCTAWNRASGRPNCSRS